MSKLCLDVVPVQETTVTAVVGNCGQRQSGFKTQLQLLKGVLKVAGVRTDAAPSTYMACGTVTIHKHI